MLPSIVLPLSRLSPTKGEEPKAGANRARENFATGPASAAADRERPLSGEKADAAGGRLPVLPHSPAHHLGLRGDAVATQGLRLLGPVDRPRAEPPARPLLRTSAG